MKMKLLQDSLQKKGVLFKTGHLTKNG